MDRWMRSELNNVQVKGVIVQICEWCQRGARKTRLPLRIKNAKLDEEWMSLCLCHMHVHVVVLFVILLVCVLFFFPTL